MCVCEEEVCEEEVCEEEVCVRGGGVCERGGGAAHVATSPKSMSASLYSDWSLRRRRLPGCGSEWKKPTCSSCTRKHSCPMAMSSLISSGGHADSLQPSTHWLTITRCVV